VTDPNAPDQYGAGVPPTPPPPAQPGYGGPAQPGYGAPGQGDYNPQAYATAPAAKTNVLAIVSLIASIAGIVIFWFIGSVVGIICGHISLNQIKKTGEEGRGLAVAGLIVGYVGIALSLIAGVIIAISIWFAVTYGTVTTY
jgi:hypothetical protein